MAQKLSAVIIFVLGTTLSAAESAQPNWPQFRGPGGLGVAAPGSYPTQFGPERNMLWKTPIPLGVSSPCVWGDRIFLTTYDPQAKKLETICLDRADGKIVWRRVAQARQIERVHEVSSPANATPTTDGQRVYVYFASLGLLCYDFDGTEQWRYPLPLVRSRFGNGTSPIVAGSRVYLSRAGRGQAPLTALDSKTGEVVWTATAGRGAAYATPVRWNSGQGQQIVVLASGRLSAYDAISGEQVWWLPGLPRQACATPVLAHNRIYTSVTGPFGEPDNFLGFPAFAKALEDYDNNDDGLLQVDEVPDDLIIVDRRASRGAGNSGVSLFRRGFDRNSDKVISKQEWEQLTSGVSQFLSQQKPALIAVRLGGEGNVRSSHVDWQFERGVAEVPSPLLYEGHIYTVRNGGIVHCRDAETGKQRYRGRLGAVGGYYASPVAANQHIYFASDRGEVVVISAGDSLQVTARNDIGESIMATPALVDNAVYLRTENAMYAFAE